MKSTSLLLAALASTLLLSQCVLPATARNNGAKVNLPYAWTLEYGETMEWTGGKTEKGFANGKGKLFLYAVDGKKRLEMDTECAAGKFHGPYVWRSFKDGIVYAEVVGTYSKGIQVGEFGSRYFQADTPDSYVMKKGSYNGYGQLHGQCEQRTLDGTRYVSQWSNGSHLSKTIYNPDGSVKQPVAAASSSSSYSDTDILGGMFALGGLAGGDANLLMGGVSMMAGDDAGAIQHIANMGGGGGSTGGLTGAAAGQAPKKIVANKRSLFDLPSHSHLARFRSAEGDHIKFYIDSADRAYADYKRTGEEQYYTRHREYADTALQFHKQTSTQGTRMIR
ncbi:MAG TPA: hypothetical protein PK490_12135 [Prosthecobacter sp.]|nr:hypothetical protein [Prosthecobacter sp.]HRK15035.1 hypothetical protein [Prosthecobacter sp.]